MSTLGTSGNNEGATLETKPLIIIIVARITMVVIKTRTIRVVTTIKLGTKTKTPIVFDRMKPLRGVRLLVLYLVVQKFLRLILIALLLLILTLHLQALTSQKDIRLSPYHYLPNLSWSRLFYSYLSQSASTLPATYPSCIC